MSSRPLYLVLGDDILNSPESEAENLRNFALCQQAFGQLVPDAAETTVLYRDFWCSEHLSLPNLRAVLSSLPSACIAVVDRGRLRIRIYRSGRRRYSKIQILLAGLCVLLAIGILWLTRSE
jgi:hypothetical protein